MISGVGGNNPIGSNTFVIFPDYQTGWNAMIANLGTDRYQNLTVGSAISTWAPSSAGNNPVAYGQTVSSWTGLTVDTNMNSLSSSQINSVANAIQRYEGWKPGVVTFSY